MSNDPARASGDSFVDALRVALAGLAPDGGAPGALDQLVQLGLDRLPMPGAGDTLTRWRMLAAVAEHDLSLAKLYEGHTDALAILDELGASDLHTPGATWGVWAAEAPGGRAIAVGAGDSLRLNGGKCWCSGAASASHALLTTWGDDGSGPQLASVALRQPGVGVSTAGWHAVGMAGSASLDVAFDGVAAQRVGVIGAYLARPGFWHGGAGIAACWYGGALAIAEAMRRQLLEASPAARSPFRLAALGRVDVALQSTAATLRVAAARIDAHPREPAHALALRARLAAERCATEVLDEVGRALGATPFCRNARFARAAADLPVFIRQSHAERDFAALGEQLAVGDAAPWNL